KLDHPEPEIHQQIEELPDNLGDRHSEISSPWDDLEESGAEIPETSEKAQNQPSAIKDMTLDQIDLEEFELW
nr:hypothetical protein [Xenococcus sp. MO_188.B8]